MTHIYTSAKPIYSLFNLKVDLSNYLLNDYQYIIEYNYNYYENYEDEPWEKSLNTALLRLGNYLINKDVNYLNK